MVDQLNGFFPHRVLADRHRQIRNIYILKSSEFTSSLFHSPDMFIAPTPSLTSQVAFSRVAVMGGVVSGLVIVLASGVAFVRR